MNYRVYIVCALLLLCACKKEAPPPAQVLAGRIICFDPCYPSETTAGDIEVGGISQSSINRVVCARCAERARQLGARAFVLTNSSTPFIAATNRALIAYDSGADVYVRITSALGGERGVHIYYPGRQGSYRGRRGPSQYVIGQSSNIARIYYDSCVSVFNGVYPVAEPTPEHNVPYGAISGAFPASVYSRMPVVMIVAGSINDSRDNAFMQSESGQLLMTETAMRALERYFNGTAATNR